MGFWRDLIFNHFRLQVTALSFWIELDLIFTLFCMQVTIMTFWIELDLNFAFFFMQVIHMLFLGRGVGLYLCLLLHAGDHHDVLD